MCLRDTFSKLSVTSEPEYEIKQAYPEDMRWIAQLEADTYCAGDAVPYGTLMEWYEGNPCGLSVFQRPDREVPNSSTSSATNVRIIPIGDKSILLLRIDRRCASTRPQW